MPEINSSKPIVGTLHIPFVAKNIYVVHTCLYSSKNVMNGSRANHMWPWYVNENNTAQQCISSVTIWTVMVIECLIRCTKVQYFISYSLQKCIFNLLGKWMILTKWVVPLKCDACVLTVYWSGCPVIHDNCMRITDSLDEINNQAILFEPFSLCLP